MEAAFEPAHLGQPIEHAFRHVEESLRRYKCDELALAYNGGKDSDVLLHLLDLACNKRVLETKDKSYSVSRILTIYFLLENSFQEVTDYVASVSKIYNLNTVTLGNFKEGLQIIKDQYPNIKAIFMGTRRDDPHSAHLKVFHPTDPGWPEFIRINPILDLEYHHICKYIQYYKLLYCKLYDDGYTSIGEKHNTLPNPALKYVDPEGIQKFYPAYRLQDGSKERDGRFRKE